MKKLPYILIALFATSCLIEVPIDIPKSEDITVINSLLCTGDSATVYLSMSYSAYGNPEKKSPGKATVTITDNNFITHQFKTSNPSGSNIKFKSNFVPQEGHHYQLSVAIDGKDTLSSQCIIPQIVNVDTSYYYQAPPEWEGDETIVIRINFTDPASEANYYLVGYSIYGSRGKFFPENNQSKHDKGFLYKQYHFLAGLSANLNTNEPLIGEVKFNDDQILCFDDTKINGSNYTLSIGFRDLDRADFEAILIIPRLYSISADTYWYFKSINVASKNFESLIAEPTKMYTNISKGLGIFGGMAMSTDSLLIVKDDLD